MSPDVIRRPLSPRRGTFVREDPSSSEAAAAAAARNFGRRSSLWALAGPKKQTDVGAPRAGRGLRWQKARSRGLRRTWLLLPIRVDVDFLR